MDVDLFDSFLKHLNKVFYQFLPKKKKYIFVKNKKHTCYLLYHFFYIYGTQNKDFVIFINIKCFVKFIDIFDNTDYRIQKFSYTCNNKPMHSKN